MSGAGTSTSSCPRERSAAFATSTARMHAGVGGTKIVSAYTDGIERSRERSRERERENVRVNEGMTERANISRKE